MVKTIAILGGLALVLSLGAQAQVSRVQNQQPRSIEYRLPVARNDSGPSFYKRKSEWQKIIDDYWGPGDSYSRKLSVFNSFASYVRMYFPAFGYSHLNWDSVAAYWRARITDSTSRGAFHAIISKFMYSLDEWHAYAGDDTVWATPMSPGVPVVYYSTDARHFGAALTPMPDTSLLVYKVAANHPLGLQPGDRILGYEGVPWPQLFDEVTEAGIGTDYLTGACPSVKEYYRRAYAGMFWHLFDTVDVVKYGTGETVHLPTAPLMHLDRSAPLLHCEQLPIPGVPMPSEDLLAGVVTYGIVEGTNIGYIYVRHQTAVQLPAQFNGAVHALENTDGLIVDLRLDWGGSYGLMIGLGRLMSYGDSTLIFKMRRSATELESLITYSGGGSDLSIPADAGTTYDRPIAVLLGPQCRSYGDISARQFAYVPGVRFFGKSPGGAYSGWWYSPGVSIPGYTFWCPDVIEVDHRFPDVQLLNKEFPVDEDVWLTPDDVANGEDTVVKRALAWIQKVGYAHDVKVARRGPDTIAILARIENPLGHALRVVATLKNGSGLLLDSLILADDGLHGDSAAADGTWGSIYAPAQDDTIYVHMRTYDQSEGTSRALPYAATYLFTHKALLWVENQRVNFGPIDDSMLRRDTTFVVRNLGGSEDSIDISLDYVLVSPESAIAISPALFALAPGDSQDVTFSVYPPLLTPSYYSAIVWVQSRCGYGQTRYSKVMMFQKIDTGVGVEEEGNIPKTYALDQNYPNPFNPSTTIKYDLPTSSDVRLSVYDMLGREVSVLVNERRDAGVHEVTFDASGFSSGVYCYRMQVRPLDSAIGRDSRSGAGDFVQSRKLIVLK
jgi:hypothetical protein